VSEGDAVELSAKLKGTEPIQVNWTKDKKPLADSATVKITYTRGDAVLKISKASPADAGLYSINAKNSHGSASCSASLGVKGRDMLHSVIVCYIVILVQKH